MAPSTIVSSSWRGTYAWVEAGKVNEFYRLNQDTMARDAQPTSVNWTYGPYSFAAQDALQWGASNTTGFPTTCRTSKR